MFSIIIVVYINRKISVLTHLDINVIGTHEPQIYFISERALYQ